MCISNARPFQSSLSRTKKFRTIHFYPASNSSKIHRETNKISLTRIKRSMCISNTRPFQSSLRCTKIPDYSFLSIVQILQKIHREDFLVQNQVPSSVGTYPPTTIVSIYIPVQSDQARNQWIQLVKAALNLRVPWVRRLFHEHKRVMSIKYTQSLIYDLVFSYSAKSIYDCLQQRKLVNVLFVFTKTIISNVYNEISAVTTL